MNENLKAILKAASEDDELMSQATALMNELNVATDEARPEIVARIVALANERGFVLTEDDFLIETPAEGQLEDEELAVVAGGCGSSGYKYVCPIPGDYTSDDCMRDALGISEDD